VIGLAKDTTGLSKLKSAKIYMKKSVFALYNVSKDESVETVSKFVSELCNADPISVFKVKPSGDSGENSTDISDDHVSKDDDKPSTFRICIDRQFINKFMDPQAWYSGIVVKPWKFKPKQVPGVKSAATPYTTTNNGGTE
jgi:hypothetical protein